MTLTLVSIIVLSQFNHLSPSTIAIVYQRTFNTEVTTYTFISTLSRIFLVLMASLLTPPSLHLDTLLQRLHLTTRIHCIRVNFTFCKLFADPQVDEPIVAYQQP